MKKNKCYIIAEIGINHDGKLENVIKLIKYAKKAGASAVKFQVYDPHTLGRREDDDAFARRLVVDQLLHELSLHWIVAHVSSLKNSFRWFRNGNADFFRGCENRGGEVSNFRWHGSAKHQCLTLLRHVTKYLENVVVKPNV